MDNQSINKNVFFSSFLFILILTAVASIWPSELGVYFKELQAIIVAKTGWLYVLTVGTIMFVCFWLITSRLGDIKLGPDHIDPEYNNMSWFSMLFSAVMGIGLMFYGISEPPDYAPENRHSYVRAEVFLQSGGQDYDVYGYNQEQIVADFITQYEKHFHFLYVNNSEIHQS